jgi:hypothetical protein
MKYPQRIILILAVLCYGPSFGQQRHNGTLIGHLEGRAPAVTAGLQVALSKLSTTYRIDREDTTLTTTTPRNAMVFDTTNAIALVTQSHRDEIVRQTGADNVTYVVSQDSVIEAIVLQFIPGRKIQDRIWHFFGEPTITSNENTEHITSVWSWDNYRALCFLHEPSIIDRDNRKMLVLHLYVRGKHL